MIQKKICMLGSFAVGKTSLVRRFVESMYTDKYHTTVGVKVDKKTVKVGEQETTLLLWDLEGSETEHDLRKSYLRGASGYLLVADGTRKETLYHVLSLQLRAQEADRRRAQRCWCRSPAAARPRCSPGPGPGRRHRGSRPG